MAYETRVHDSRSDVVAIVGFAKFTSDWIGVFEQIGVGQWFRYFTGCVQMTAAALMVVRKTSLIGVFILVCTMIGAIIAQIRVLEGLNAAVVPASLVAVLLVIAVIEFFEWRERR